jgi:hypothetical protein
VIPLAILASACEVEFEPKLTPIYWQPGDLPQAPGALQPQSTLDPASLVIPREGTREELLYLAELLGFGRDGLPGIDELFNPYLREHSLTGEVASGTTPGLLAAAESFYGGSEQLAQVAGGDPDNPLNFWEDDPLTTLTGDARIDMAAYMVSSYNKHHLALFLEEIGADPSLYWNYEPAWLVEKMAQNPLALRRAQFELLRSYAADPDLWQWIQQAKPAGPTE